MLVLDQKVLLFLQVAIVVGVPLILWGPLRLGRVFPLPIIQIFAGIALGESIFGAIAPDTFAFFFRKEVTSGIETLANVALVLFVFLAGCEADRSILRKSADMVVRIGFTGVFVPWILGTIAALMLARLLPTEQLVGTLGNLWLYAISFGLCMAVTALPVLSILLRELGFNQRPIGTIALAVGGVDDALLWLSLSVILPFAAGSSNILAATLLAAGGGVATALLLAYGLRPLLDMLIARQAQERLLISSAMLILFFAAAVNEATGLHAAIGAFLVGLLLPNDLRHKCQDRLDIPVTLLLLPFLFLATGLKTKFAFGDPTVWTIVLVAMIVCVGGKFIGVSLPARMAGQSVGFSTTLGVLMQCKGLMEIVIVTVLYQKGVIGQATFSALVLVALISTAITVPMARLSVRIFGASATEAVDQPTVANVPAGAAAVAGIARLEFEGGHGTFPLGKPEIVIGRHSQDDIRINDLRVSRHHARLKQVGDTYEIYNLTAVRSEPNPILINGAARERALLADGDSVSVGGVNFKFITASKS